MLNSCKILGMSLQKESSLVVYLASLCFQDGPTGVQVSKKWLSKNTLNLSLNPDIVCTDLTEVNLIACS